MILLEDTRNPVAKHQNIHDYCDRAGIKIERTKLYVGDYTLPTNQSVCIDTKAGLQEVYGNLVIDYARFKREALRSSAAKIKLIVLVEEPHIETLADVTVWQNPRANRWRKVHDAHLQGKMQEIKIADRPPESSVKLAQKMAQISRQFGIVWKFCSPDETGERIIDMLGGAKP